MTGTLNIPTMPDLWHMDKLYVGHKALKGALAHWAVHQSPYVAPDRLGEAIEQFMHEWPYEDFAPMSSQELRERVGVLIKSCPLIAAWNEPRLSGAVSEGGHAFVSRYDTLKPDYDFIDLDALVRNVTHELVLWAQVESAQDGYRDSVAA